MTFLISKLVGMALATGTVLLTLSLLWQRRRRAAARTLLALALVLATALSLCPLSKWPAGPQNDQAWLLVTSAWHMPRAIGCFRKAGWNVRAYPVNFAGTGSRCASFDAGTEPYQSTLAENEWVGLLAYHLLGRTDAWFPHARGGALQ